MSQNIAHQYSFKAMHVADSLAAGSAVGYGVQLMTNLDLFISIVAGILVAASAGVSLYLNLKRRQEEKAEKAAREESE